MQSLQILPSTQNQSVAPPSDVSIEGRTLPPDFLLLLVYRCAAITNRYPSLVHVAKNAGTISQIIQLTVHRAPTNLGNNSRHWSHDPEPWSLRLLLMLLMPCVRPDGSDMLPRWFHGILLLCDQERRPCHGHISATEQ